MQMATIVSIRHVNTSYWTYEFEQYKMTCWLHTRYFFRYNFDQVREFMLAYYWLYMDYKFQVLFIIYFGTVYLMKFIYSENEICYLSSLHLKYPLVLMLLIFFLPGKLSVKMLLNLWAEAEKIFYWNIPLYANIPSYCSYWCKTAILFCYIFRSCHWGML